jgi:hypothetical protein
MSLTLPGELVWVLDLLGYNWPEVDEGALHKVGETWRAFGEDLERIQREGEGLARTVISHNAGTAVEEFSKAWGAYTGANGEDSYLPDAKTACEVIAFAFDAAAVAVLAAKLAVIAQLIALAIEIIAAQAAAPFTFGLSEIGALGATQATRLVVRELLDRLKREVMEAVTKAMEHATMDALKKVAKKVVQDQVKQFVQEKVVDAVKDKAKEAAIGMAQNVGQQSIEAYFDARSGIDLGETADVAKTAAGEYLDGLKSEVTGGEGSALAGYADPNTYVDHATEGVTGAVGDRTQQGVDALVGQSAGGAHASDGDTAAATAADSGASPAAQASTRGGATTSAARTGASGSTGSSGNANDWARSEFG